MSESVVPNGKNRIEAIEKVVDIRTAIHRINPRQADSYMADAMKYDLADHDFVLLNVMLYCTADEAFAASLMKENPAIEIVPFETVMIVQGHRRTSAIVGLPEAGIVGIVEEPAAWGLTPEAAEALCHQKVKFFEGLSEWQARELAFDEAYHVGLQKYEAAIEVQRMLREGRDRADVALRCGKVICETGMVPKGNLNLWQGVVKIRSYKDRADAAYKLVQNAIKHIDYAERLGLGDLAVSYYKHFKDNIPIKEGTVIPFPLGLTEVNALHSAAIVKNSKPAKLVPEWEGPIRNFQFNPDHTFKSVDGGTPEVCKLVGEYCNAYTQKTGTTRKALSANQKKEILQNMKSEIGKAVAGKLITTEGEYLALDLEAERRDRLFAALRESFDLLPNEERKQLAEAVLLCPSVERFLEIWLTPPPEAPPAPPQQKGQQSSKKAHK